MNNYFKQFGGRVTATLTRQYAQSDNWRNGCFQNLEETALAGNLRDLPRIIYKQLSHRQGRQPNRFLPVLPFNKDSFVSPAEKSKFIWFGHSAMMMRMAGLTLLVDPMLGPDTTPIAPIASRRFSEHTLDLIKDFPTIDLVLLTHDHYDHLDFASIQKLKSKTSRYFVSLGVKRHLMAWGVPGNQITEFDWWQTEVYGDIKITFTPTRHFSGRGLRDRSKTLWGGWVFATPGEKVWFSGDGGYGNHFTEIGSRLGPFDFAFMECGQYNEDWHDVHLFPDEAVQAAVDAEVKKAMPVHWGAFALSYQHTWSEPAADFVQSASERSVNYALPNLGQIFQVDSIVQDKWWTSYE